MMFKNAKEAVDYIENLKGIKSNFENAKNLFAKYGNFQNELKCIHVAGTNGKGSTTNFIRSILQEANYKVGTFTSPYLEVHNDRIRVNNNFISDADFLFIANKFYDDITSRNYAFFELDTLIALYYIYISKVDYAVIEVGIGGRLDATNVITPILSVITNIGYDHMEKLGDTLEKIAYEKAGIIKNNIPVIVGCNLASEAKKVIKNEAIKKQAPFIESDSPKEVFINDQYLHFTLDTSYITSCMALYQSENASLAISAINYLVEKNIIKVSKEAIFKGIKNTFWLGRFERMLNNPKVYIDGAHNIHGISALVTTIQQFIDKGYNPKIVFSALKDKETSKMLEKLLSLRREIYVTEFDFYRSKKAIEIAGNYDVFVQEDWKVLIKDLISQSQEHNIIIITGSLYFISQVRPFLLEMRSDMNE